MFRLIVTRQLSSGRFRLTALNTSPRRCVLLADSAQLRSAKFQIDASCVDPNALEIYTVQVPQRKQIYFRWSSAISATHCLRAMHSWCNSHTAGANTQLQHQEQRTAEATHTHSSRAMQSSSTTLALLGTSGHGADASCPPGRRSISKFKDSPI